MKKEPLVITLLQNYNVSDSALQKSKQRRELHLPHRQMHLNIYTICIKPWLLNDYGTLLIGREHGEVHGIYPKVFWRVQTHTVNPNSCRMFH